MQCFMVQTDDTGAPEVRLPAGDASMRGIARGDRVVFYQLHGDGDAQRGVFVAWGEVDRLGAEDAGGVAHLRAVTPLKRRVPFSELRADPRRSRDATVQPIPAEIVNLVLARSRR